MPPCCTNELAICWQVAGLIRGISANAIIKSWLAVLAPRPLREGGVVAPTPARILALIPDSASAQTTTSNPCCRNKFRNTSSSARTTQINRPTATARFCAARNPSAVPSGNGARHLSPPKRVPCPAASRMPVTGCLRLFSGKLNVLIQGVLPDSFTGQGKYGIRQRRF